MVLLVLLSAAAGGFVEVASMSVRAGLAEGYSPGWWRSAVVLRADRPAHPAPEGCGLRSAFCSWRLGAFFVNSWLAWCPQGGLLGPVRFAHASRFVRPGRRLQAAAFEFAHTQQLGWDKRSDPGRPQSRLFRWCFSFRQLIPFQPCLLMYMYPSRQGVLQRFCVVWVVSAVSACACRSPTCTLADCLSARNCTHHWSWVVCLTSVPKRL